MPGPAAFDMRVAAEPPVFGKRARRQRGELPSIGGRVQRLLEAAVGSAIAEEAFSESRTPKPSTTPLGASATSIALKGPLVSDLRDIYVIQAGLPMLPLWY